MEPPSLQPAVHHTRRPRRRYPTEQTMTAIGRNARQARSWWPRRANGLPPGQRALDASRDSPTTHSGLLQRTTNRSFASPRPTSARLGSLSKNCVPAPSPSQGRPTSTASPPGRRVTRHGPVSLSPAGGRPGSAPSPPNPAPLQSCADVMATTRCSAPTTCSPTT